MMFPVKSVRMTLTVRLFSCGGVPKRIPKAILHLRMLHKARDIVDLDIDVSHDPMARRCSQFRNIHASQSVLPITCTQVDKNLEWAIAR
jgi:hypothetical protein